MNDLSSLFLNNQEGTLLQVTWVLFSPCHLLVHFPHKNHVWVVEAKTTALTHLKGNKK